MHVLNVLYVHACAYVSTCVHMGLYMHSLCVQLCMCTCMYTLCNHIVYVHICMCVYACMLPSF